MKRPAAFWLILLAGLLATSFVTTRTDTYTGYAYQAGTQTLVYTEQFTDTYVNGKLVATLTRYYDVNQRLIATRTLDFSKSYFAPDFEIKDFRTGYEEGASVNAGHVSIYVKKDLNALRETQTLTVPGDVVIDGGFNQYIRANWDDLLRGEEVSFNFTIPSAFDFYKIRAVKVAESKNEISIAINLSNPVLRLLAKPILVRYDQTTKRIISYEGKSNVANDTGKNFMIKLVYPKGGP